MLTVTELMNEMKAIFDHGPKKLPLRHEFEKRKWNPNEPFSDYHHDKIILANNVPIADEETINYIVEGIHGGKSVLQTCARDTIQPSLLFFFFFFFFFRGEKRMHLRKPCGTQPKQYPLNSKLPCFLARQ